MPAKMPAKKPEAQIVGSIRVRDILILGDPRVFDVGWINPHQSSSSWAVDFTGEAAESLSRRVEYNQTRQTLADGTIRIQAPHQQAARMIEETTRRTIQSRRLAATVHAHALSVSRERALDVCRGGEHAGVVQASQHSFGAAQLSGDLVISVVHDDAGRVVEMRITRADSQS